MLVVSRADAFSPRIAAFSPALLLFDLGIIAANNATQSPIRLLRLEVRGGQKRPAATPVQSRP
jgi:hypothetical protein